MTSQYPDIFSERCCPSTGYAWLWFDVAVSRGDHIISKPHVLTVSCLVWTHPFRNEEKKSCWQRTNHHDMGNKSTCLNFVCTPVDVSIPLQNFSRVFHVEKQKPSNHFYLSEVLMIFKQPAHSEVRIYRLFCPQQFFTNCMGLLMLLLECIEDFCCRNTSISLHCILLYIQIQESDFCLILLLM
jgi:hypothetical protein